jgi:hypothetical protein
MKSDEQKPSLDSVAAGNFMGHVTGYALGHDLRLELRNKKGKRRSCLVAASHPLFSALAETISHAHWADRKITVCGEMDEKDLLTIHSLQVGDDFKPQKVRKQKTDGAAEAGS